MPCQVGAATGHVPTKGTRVSIEKEQNSWRGSGQPKCTDRREEAEERPYLQ